MLIHWWCFFLGDDDEIIPTTPEPTTPEPTTPGGFLNLKFLSNYFVRKINTYQKWLILFSTQNTFMGHSIVTLSIYEITCLLQIHT